MILINKQLKGTLYLIICSFVWGMAFAAQSNAMNYIEPFTFVFLRSTITCLILTAALPFLTRISGSNKNDACPSMRRHFILGGILGCFLAMATILQQVGLVYTTPAKSGFVTALYIVIVPVLGLFLGRRVRLPVWIGVVLSLVGLVLLCVKEDLSINVGDLFTLGSALVFSFHIMLIDRRAGSMNALKLSAIQFAACAIIAGIAAFTFESPSLEGILACWTSILYVAVFSGAVGYTLQMVGQKYTDPTLASLIMCLESVFAAIGGWLILGQTLIPREILGCVLMLAASVVALLPERRKVAQNTLGTHEDA